MNDKKVIVIGGGLAGVEAANQLAKKGIKVDPLQITMEFSRNFPLDRLQEAQTAQAEKAAGLPERIVYENMSIVDDVDYVMELKEAEKESAMKFYEKAQKTASNNITDEEETDDKKDNDSELEEE